jgi:GT2 family glycosyltransferase
MPPAVSVLVPVWNRERWVREAIDCVLAQTFTDFEVIVVDDGSTDGTCDVLAAVDDPRVLVLHGEHGGVSAAMNRGLARARGRYVARLDSDDVWLPDLLATQVGVLETRPEIGVAYARAQGMRADGTLTTDVWGIAPRHPGDDLASMVEGDFTCNITTVARREHLERVGGFDESLRTSEDWDLWLRVARHARFAFTDRVLAHFRWHEGNLTGPGSPAGAALEERTRVLDKLFADPDLPPRIRAMAPVAYRNVHVGVGLLRLSRREWRGAGRAFGRALATGANPIGTLARIGWFTLDWWYLSHRPWGRRFIDWQSRTRRRWRGAGASS